MFIYYEKTQKVMIIPERQIFKDAVDNIRDRKFDDAMTKLQYLDSVKFPDCFAGSLAVFAYSRKKDDFPLYLPDVKCYFHDNEYSNFLTPYGEYLVAHTLSSMGEKHQKLFSKLVRMALKMPAKTNQFLEYAQKFYIRSMDKEKNHLYSSLELSILDDTLLNRRLLAVDGYKKTLEIVNQESGGDTSNDPFLREVEHLCYLRLSGLYGDLHDFDSALTHMEKAFRMNPSSATKASLAGLYARAGRWDDAKRLSSEAFSSVRNVQADSFSEGMKQTGISYHTIIDTWFFYPGYILLPTRRYLEGGNF